jgi:nitroreductase
MDFDRVLRSRRMVRDFAAVGVEPAVLDRVLGSASRAPAAGNTAAVDLVVLEGRDETERYWAVTFGAEGRAAFRWQGLFDAPVLAVVVVEPAAYPERYAEADKAATGLGAGVDAWPVPYWWVDAGMAIENVLLAAVADGLGACFFGVFEHEEPLRLALGIPPGRRLVGTIALGHPLPGPAGRSAGRRRDVPVHRGKWWASEGGR